MTHIADAGVLSVMEEGHHSAEFTTPTTRERRVIREAADEQKLLITDEVPSPWKKPTPDLAKGIRSRDWRDRPRRRASRASIIYYNAILDPKRTKALGKLWPILKSICLT